MASEDESVVEMRHKIEAFQAVLAKKEYEVSSALADASAARAEVDRMVDNERSRASTVGRERMVYLTQPRRLERFRGKPEKSSDVTVEEWVEDAEATLATRQLGEKDKAAFLIEHLAGEARREVCGRGIEIKDDPDEIFAVLTKVFGDGDSLSQLQQRFFAYRQGEKEGLVTCSLRLVDLYDRMMKLDPSFDHGRDTQLKSRLAEAARDESIRMELRRMNCDHPEYSFFDVRDHIIELMGRGATSSKPKSDVSVREVAANDDWREMVKAMGVQMAKQQQQIDSLCKLMQAGEPRQRYQRRQGSNASGCWHCSSPDHFRRDCPEFKKGVSNGTDRARHGNLN
jgi:hypothetical protein